MHTKRSFLIFLSLLLSLLLFFPYLSSGQDKPTAAVIDLTAEQGVSSSLSRILSDSLRASLFGTKEYTLLSRENMEELLQEQKFQLSGCTTEQCIVKIGRLLGAQKMFTDSLGKAGTTYVIILKLLDVESGEFEQIKEERCPRCPDESLLETIRTIALKISGRTILIEDRPALKKEPSPAPTTQEEAKPGTLSITSTPSNAKVFLDGEEKGTTPIENLLFSSGKHNLVLLKDGYQDYLLPINIDPDKIIEIKATMKPQTGNLIITTSPSPANIYLDNTYQGESPKTITDLSTGEHTIRAEKQNYQPQEKKITIISKKETSLSLSLSLLPGSCLLTSTPDKAEVFLDGTKKGATPLSLQSIPSGKHQVKFSLAGYQDYTQEIEIKPNENTYLSADLQAYTGPAIQIITKDTSEMVLIPEGEFLMGSPPGVGEADEYPQHSVFLSAYYIDKYEVTVAQYKKFCEATNRKMPRKSSWSWQNTHPIVNVAWDDAVAYANYYGKRLPTEAEWEKAARAGSAAKQQNDSDEMEDRIPGFGSAPLIGILFKRKIKLGSAKTDLKDYAWSAVNSKRQTHPVGTKKPNAFGLYDTAGNVWEWCSDWYADDYYKNSPKDNPQGPASGTLRVLRGGSWGSPEDYCRPANRNWYNPEGGSVTFGFRCASSPITQ